MVRSLMLRLREVLGVSRRSGLPNRRTIPSSNRHLGPSVVHDSSVSSDSDTIRLTLNAFGFMS